MPMSEKPPLTNLDDIQAESRVPLSQSEVDERIGWQKKRQDGRLRRQIRGGKLPSPTRALQGYIRKVFGK